MTKVEEPLREEVLPEVEEQDFESIDVRMRFGPESIPEKTSSTHYEYLQEEVKDIEKEAEEEERERASELIE